MNRIEEMKSNIERQKGRQELRTLTIEKKKGTIESLKRSLRYAEQAQQIIQAVSQLTQETLEYRVSEIVTMALSGVFEDPYELIVEFVPKRGKTEANIIFQRNEEDIDPMTSSGGGAIDVASFGLRIAMWKLKKPQSRGCFLLDEPFKHLKGLEDNERALQMVEQISQKLQIQIIMVGDERAPREMIISSADRIIEVKRNKTSSQVEILNPDKVISSIPVPMKEQRRRRTK